MIPVLWLTHTQREAAWKNVRSEVKVPEGIERVAFRGYPYGQHESQSGPDSSDYLARVAGSGVSRPRHELDAGFYATRDELDSRELLHASFVVAV